MADDFDFDVQSAAEVAQDVAITLADRERAAKGGGGAEAGARARTRLDELDRAVKRLEGALVELERSGVGAGGGAGGRALAARREAVRKLAIEAKRLREREHSSAFAAGSDRDALLGAGNGKSYGRESELTRDMTTQEMVQHANVQIKAQDAVLDKMSKSLDTLKTMGGAIRDETALQMVRAAGRAVPRTAPGAPPGVRR